MDEHRQQHYCFPGPDWQGLRSSRWLGELDRQLGSLIGGLEPQYPDWLATATALASRAAANGQVYLDLHHDPGIDQTWPDIAAWLETLSASALVGGTDSQRPLILDSAGRLYLCRFHTYMQDLVRDLHQRAALLPRRFNQARLQRTLDRLDASVTGFAAVSPLVLGTAALCRVCVVQASSSTWADLISALLAVLMEQLGRRLNVHLSGPATQRDSLVMLLHRLASNSALSAAERSLLPQQPLDLEQLPRERGGTAQQGREPPLRSDLVVVTGAEAADLVMLARLVRVLPPYTRLVLLGDLSQAHGNLRSPFAALLAGPGQSRGFRRRLAAALGESLGGGVGSACALQNAVVSTVGGASADGLHEALWASAAGDTGRYQDSFEEDRG